jgi:hypothetical protein
MVRTAANDVKLAQRMERSFARRVVLLLVLVATIGGTCVAKADGSLDPVAAAMAAMPFGPEARASPL